MVVQVLVLTQEFKPALEASYRTGRASARVVRSLKGPAREGAIVTYKVADGDRDDGSCPGRRATYPGGRYTLYLLSTIPGEPPEIMLPTD